MVRHLQVAGAIAGLAGIPLAGWLAGGVIPAVVALVFVAVLTAIVVWRTNVSPRGGSAEVDASTAGPGVDTTEHPASRGRTGYLARGRSMQHIKGGSVKNQDQGVVSVDKAAQFVDDLDIE